MEYKGIDVFGTARKTGEACAVDKHASSHYFSPLF